MTLLRAAAAHGWCIVEPARAASLGAWTQRLSSRTRSLCCWSDGSRGAGSPLVRCRPRPGTGSRWGERSPSCLGRRAQCTWGWLLCVCRGGRLHLRASPSRTPRGGAPGRGGYAQLRRLSRGDGAEARKGEGRSLAERGERGAKATTTAQKVTEAGRDLTYLGVILLGVGLTGALLYLVFIELFSSWSPNSVYTSALERCRDHPEVMAAFGPPISGYGETTRRHRRQHVTHLEFEQEGVKHMRVKFYISGSEPVKGTVHAEVVQTPKGNKFEYRYLFVELDTYPRRIIIIEDNR